MKKPKHLLYWGKFAIGGLLLAMLMGCVGVGVVDTGYVPGPYFDGFPGPGPDVAVFGGYGYGHYDHDAGNRGAASRGSIGHAESHGSPGRR